MHKSKAHPSLRNGPDACKANDSWPKTIKIKRAVDMKTAVAESKELHHGQH